ncbi:MAG: hypothetical protein ACM3SQ_07795 [Betaproteobacteria bacterium]
MPHTPDAVRALERELRDIFGPRLHSLVVYGLRVAGAPDEPGHGPHAGGHHAAPAPIHTLAIVEALGPGDLRACAARAAGWHDAGLATPLLLAASEFERALDAFPLEFGAIVADHVVVSGASPFARLSVDTADVRRACETQARSHLLHLREGFIETRGRGDALALLVVQSAAPFAALVQSIGRLLNDSAGDPAAAARHVGRAAGIGGDVLEEIVGLAGVDEIASSEAERLFPPYLTAVERLVAYVDGWSAA